MTDQIAVTGNITSVPERHVLSDGAVMVTFGLATTERRNENGQWSDSHTNFYNVAAFRKLAEHALSSLAKGQRVIVVGKVKVKQWETNGHKGTSVDLEATSVGPDLMFGVATFVKDVAGRSATSRPATGEPPHDGQEWATAALGDAPDGAGAPAEPKEKERGDAGLLVSAGGWSVPLDDTTPF